MSIWNFGFEDSPDDWFLVLYKILSVLPQYSSFPKQFSTKYSLHELSPICFDVPTYLPLSVPMKKKIISTLYFS